MGALSSRLWRGTIAVDDICSSQSGPLSAKRAHNENCFCRILTSIPSVTVVKEGLDDDFWSYRTYEEQSCVHNLCSLPAEQLTRCEGRFIVHVDTITWHTAVLRANLR